MSLSRCVDGPMARGEGEDAERQEPPADILGRDLEERPGPIPGRTWRIGSPLMRGHPR